jgi:hypothetical protein
VIFFYFIFFINIYGPNRSLAAGYARMVCCQLETWETGQSAADRISSPYSKNALRSPRFEVFRRCFWVGNDRSPDRAKRKICPLNQHAHPKHSRETKDSATQQKPPQDQRDRPKFPFGADSERHGKLKKATLDLNDLMTSLAAREKGS